MKEFNSPKAQAPDAIAWRHEVRHTLGLKVVFSKTVPAMGTSDIKITSKTVDFHWFLVLTGETHRFVELVVSLGVEKTDWKTEKLVYFIYTHIQDIQAENHYRYK